MSYPRHHSRDRSHIRQAPHCSLPILQKAHCRFERRWGRFLSMSGLCRVEKDEIANPRRRLILPRIGDASRRAADHQAESGRSFLEIGRHRKTGTGGTSKGKPEAPPRQLPAHDEPGGRDVAPGRHSRRPRIVLAIPAISTGAYADAAERRPERRFM